MNRAHRPFATTMATDTSPGPGGRWTRCYLAVEFSALFLALPVVLFVARHRFSRLIIPTLLAVAAMCLLLLLTDRSFDRRRLWDAGHFRDRLATTLAVFVPAALALAVAVAVLRPDLLFALPRSRPLLWLVILCLYPLVSVYPQELIYRTFLFHRYRALFPDAAVMVAVSGLAFGIAHLFFANWIAPVFTTVGGLLFAATYARTGSTLQACIEHGLWGNHMFTVGLGWYFYGGSIT